MIYNKDEVSKKFDKGKYLLDRAYYKEAIEIFTELINLTDPLKNNNKDAKLIWDVSLNNRGVAKCKVGYSAGDKALYEDGLNDYRITVNEEKDEAKKMGMTAYGNLKYGEKEILDFDSRKGVNFKFD
jgi:hypothetical protein